MDFHLHVEAIDTSIQQFQVHGKSSHLFRCPGGFFSVAGFLFRLVAHGSDHIGDGTQGPEMLVNAGEIGMGLQPGSAAQQGSFSLLRTGLHHVLREAWGLQTLCIHLLAKIRSRTAAEPKPQDTRNFLGSKQSLSEGRKIYGMPEAHQLCSSSNRVKPLASTRYGDFPSLQNQDQQIGTFITRRSISAPVRLPTTDPTITPTASVTSDWPNCTLQPAKKSRSVRRKCQKPQNRIALRANDPVDQKAGSERRL